MTGRVSGWRAYICGLYDERVAEQARRREEWAIGYDADERLFHEREPRVTFKETLIMCRGWATPPADANDGRR